jgi:hypothetical protein
MVNLSEKKIQFYFKTNSVLRKLVMLVLISINTLLPKAESVHSENSQESASEKYNSESQQIPNQIHEDSCQ